MEDFKLCGRGTVPPHSIGAKNKERLTAMTQISLFSVMMVLGARMGLVGASIPFTLQLPIAVLTGLLIGPKKGFMAQILYLLIGLIGFPVFSGGGGISYALMPSFGFLLGFPLASFCSGLISHTTFQKDRNFFIRYFMLATASLLSIALCYLTGASYFYLVSRITSGTDYVSITNLFKRTVFPFIGKDLLMMLPVVFLADRIGNLIRLRSYHPPPVCKSKNSSI